MGLFKFLKSLRTLANNRNITIDEAYKFAKQEFGEVSDLLKLQINKIFKDVEAPSIKKPSKPEGKLIEASFKPGVDKRGKRVEQSPSQAEGTIMDRLSGAANRLEELMKEREAMYRPKQGLQLSEGLTRALARKILDRKRIQVPKGQDPINVFTDIFGESIGDVKNLADEMVEIDARGGGMKNMDEMLEAEGLYDIEIPESPQRGLTDEELQKLTTEEPEDFAVGGRVGFQKGTSKIFDQLEMNVPHPYGHRVEYGAGGGVKALIKLINKKFGKGTVKLAKDVKRPESAEMREAFMAFKKRNKLAGGGAVKTILKIIQEIKKLDPMDAMKEVNEVVAKRGKYKNLSDEEVQKIFDDTNDHIFERDVKPKETDVNFDEDMGEATPMSEIETVEAMGAPMTAKTLQLMEKYPGLNLDVARKIASDPDPQRQAEVIAIIDQAFEMNKKGMSMDEIVDVFSKGTDRTKQAQGGLAYLMGL